MPSKYILEGKIAKPTTDLIQWAKWFEKANRYVRKTDLSDGVSISTVFIGIDYSIFGDKPLLFETMIFGGQHDLFCKRYSTWEEAENGHEEAIKLIFEA